MQSPVRQVGLAAFMYAQDHNETFPPAANWEQALSPYIKKQSPFTLPPGGDGRPRRVAYNTAVAGRSLASIGSPRSTAMFFESTSTAPSAADNLQSLPPSDSGGSFVVVFVDGHAQQYPASERNQVIQQSQQSLGAQ